MRQNTALVLEGGSLRCMFTAGVLDAFLDWKESFGCVAGVSAGSLSGINFVAGQRGRTERVNVRFVNDDRYLGMKSLLRHRSIFNFDFLFGEISDELEPFNRETFLNSPTRYVAFTTDIQTGESVAHEKGVSEDILLAARASSSMPLLAPIVRVDGRLCLDGGMAMPVPYRWPMEQGYEKLVVVLTQAEGYRKKPVTGTMARVIARRYRRYPALVESLLTRPERYNAQREEIESLAREGKLFIIRPDRPVTVSRVEKDVGKLLSLYREGLRVAASQRGALMEYLNA